jgi:hypothetical protein
MNPIEQYSRQTFILVNFTAHASAEGWPVAYKFIVESLNGHPNQVYILEYRDDLNDAPMASHSYFIVQPGPNGILNSTCVRTGTWLRAEDGRPLWPFLLNRQYTRKIHIEQELVITGFETPV